MQAGARFQRRRRQLQQQQPRRRQPLLWPMDAEPPPPPPWVWMVPGSAGLLRLSAGVAVPPVLLASAPPPAAALLPGLPGWPAPSEPVLPLLPLPSAPDPAAAAAHPFPALHGQWLFGGHSPSLGLPPSSTVELVPIFPHLCPSALATPIGKSWIDKRIPNCKIFFNNSFALDSTWIHPEESRLFHGHEKPHLLTNQVAVSLSRPGPASRPLPTVVLAPQPIPGGCHNSLKPTSSPAITITTAAAAAMVSMDPESLRGPSPSSVQPRHFLTLAPIKIPLRTSPFSADENACLLLGALAVMFSEFKSMSGTEAGEQQAHHPLHGDVGMYQALPRTPMTRTDLPLPRVPFPSAARQRRCLSTESELRPSPFFPFSPARVMGKWLGPFGDRTGAHFQPKTMSTSRTIFARAAHGRATSCFTKNHGMLEQAPEMMNMEEGS
ncbi:hypothetical protein H8959_011184 [Pygathrix nigripes]